MVDLVGLSSERVDAEVVRGLVGLSLAKPHQCTNACAKPGACPIEPILEGEARRAEGLAAPLAVLGWAYKAHDAFTDPAVKRPAGYGALVQDASGRWWAAVSVDREVWAAQKEEIRVGILRHLLDEAPGEVWAKAPRVNPDGCGECAAQHPADGGECEGTCHKPPEYLAADWESLGCHEGQHHFRSWKGRFVLRAEGKGPVTVDATVLLAAVVRRKGRVRLSPGDVERVKEAPAVLVARDVDSGVITLETRAVTVTGTMVKR